MQVKSHNFETISRCRSCGSSDLIPVLSLGDQYTSDFLDSKNELNGNQKIPLDLVLCGIKECSLLQTLHTASRATLFNKNYWFRCRVWYGEVIEKVHNIWVEGESCIDICWSQLVCMKRLMTMALVQEYSYVRRGTKLTPFADETSGTSTYNTDPLSTVGITICIQCCRIWWDYVF